MKVLVTGGAGFIGSHIVDALVTRGHDVVIIDDMSSGRSLNTNKDAKLYEVDIRDFQAVERVFEQERPEIVDHHAAQVSVRKSMADPGYDAQINIVGSINILQLCTNYEVQRLLFASTCAAYSEPNYLPMDEGHPTQPKSAYGMAKRTVEGYIRYYAENFGLKYKIFRYGNVYGPRQNPEGEAGVVAIFTGQLLSGVQPTIFGDGTKTRDYVYVGDIVKANLLAMDEKGDGEVYNLARGIEVSDFELFDAVRNAVGADVEPKYADVRPGEAERVSLGCSKAKDCLGWTATMPLRDGIQSVVDHYRKTHGE